MKHLLSLLLVIAFAGSYPNRMAAENSNARFETVDILIEAGEDSLAAYQFTFKAEKGQIKIVGIEGGDHPALSNPPYYDSKALKQGRIRIAAFSTARDLPEGKTRVARLHLQVTGRADPVYSVALETAANSEGKNIPVTITVAKGKSDAK